MAKANEEKSGDRLAGIAAENAEERVAAKVVLANLTLADLRTPAVPYETDEVTRIIQDDVNEKIYAPKSGTGRSRRGEGTLEEKKKTRPPPRPPPPPQQRENWTVSELGEGFLRKNNGGQTSPSPGPPPPWPS